MHPIRNRHLGKLAAFVLITTVLAIVVSFLVLEGTYRIYKIYVYGMVNYPELVSLGVFHRDEQYGVLPTPNFRFDMIPARIRFHPNVMGFEKNVTFNRWGYRGKDFSKEKSPRTFRIVVFGGSTTMNIESNDQNTWPALLEKSLNEDVRTRTPNGKASSAIEVINAGIASLRTREGLLRLKSEVQYFEPDLLLVAYNWTDVTRGVRGDDPQVPASTKTPWWYYSAVLQNIRGRYLARMVNDAGLYRELLTDLRRDSPWSKAYVSNLLEMQRIASSIGARMILVNLPGLARKSSRDTSEYDLIISRTRVTPAIFDYWVEVKSFAAALLEDVGREHDMQVIDVSAAWESHAGIQRVELFEDEMHFSDAGSREVTNALHRAMALGIGADGSEPSVSPRNDDIRN